MAPAISAKIIREPRSKKRQEINDTKSAISRWTDPQVDSQSTTIGILSCLIVARKRPSSSHCIEGGNMVLLFFLLTFVVNIE